MCNNNKAIIKFGNKEFVDVTNETTVEHTFSYYEAKVYGEEGILISTSD
jgi:hypothetical protein